MRSFNMVNLNNLNAGEIVSKISSNIIGLYVLNVSFDSGILCSKNHREFDSERWEINDEYPGRYIDEYMAKNWPASHDGIYDEWWIFDSRINIAEKRIAFCNWMISIDEYINDPMLADHPCKFIKNLNKYNPKIVFGYNHSSYLIL